MNKLRFMASSGNIILMRTLHFLEVEVINVKLELFVLNVKIYENLLLILNLCKVSKVCIVTWKELDVDFYFMNNVKRISISVFLSESSIN